MSNNRSRAQLIYSAVFLLLFLFGRCRRRAGRPSRRLTSIAAERREYTCSIALIGLKHFLRKIILAPKEQKNKQTSDGKTKQTTTKSKRNKPAHRVYISFVYRAAPVRRRRDGNEWRLFERYIVMKAIPFRPPEPTVAHSHESRSWLRFVYMLFKFPSSPLFTCNTCGSFIVLKIVPLDFVFTKENGKMYMYTYI